MFIGVKGCWALKDKNCFKDADMLVVETNPLMIRYFFRQNGYLIPEWVNMKININQPMAFLKRRSISDFSDVVRLIRKYHWDYVVKVDRQAYDAFYFRMYLPYLKSKHNDKAIIISYRQFRQLCDSAFLLLVQRNNVPLAGVLVQYDQKRIVLSKLGIIDGEQEYVKEGVIGALYYFSVLESQKRGYGKLDIGGGRPFLKDGLTRYKMGLGGELDFDCNLFQDYLCLTWRAESEYAKEFLKDNPMICLGSDGKLKVEKYKDDKEITLAH